MKRDEAARHRLRITGILEHALLIPGPPPGSNLLQADRSSRKP